MAIYAATSSKSGVNTATTTMWSLWSTGGSLYIQTLIVQIPVAPTTIPDLYVVRTTARGTQTATVAGNPYDPNDNAATGTLDTTWSANPTVGAVGTAMLRMPLPLSAGATFYWTADTLNAMWVRNAAGLAIVNGNASGATTGTFNLTIAWRE
jgi:hypothetical protein